MHTPCVTDQAMQVAAAAPGLAGLAFSTGVLARRVVEEEEPFWKGDELLSRLQLDLLVSTNGLFRVLNNIADLRLSTKAFVISGPLDSLSMKGAIRVDGGFFTVPGLRGEFNVKGDSKIEFDPGARWPETPFVDVRGSNVQFDPTEQQRNVELALRGTGISPQDLNSPRSKMSVSQLLTAYRNALEFSRDQYFAVRLGQNVKVTTYGIYGYAMLSSPTQRALIQLALKYNRLINSGG